MVRSAVKPAKVKAPAVRFVQHGGTLTPIRNQTNPLLADNKKPIVHCPKCSVEGVLEIYHYATSATYPS